MRYPEQYQVIVVGGGHAGTEACLAAARMGMRTLLLTHNIETIGQMSCNPAIGGIGKGHLVKEIDALGGVMAKAADRAGIHFRTLNQRKGPAVRATRAQADRALYRSTIREFVEKQEHLDIFQQPVSDLLLEGDRICGVVGQSGIEFYAPTVILTAGTFLAGKIHVGLQHHPGGRAGDPPADALSRKMRELPLRVGRLKTGTPPRLDGRSIDYSRLQEQPGDTPRPIFSFTGHREEHPRQISCWITETNPKSHDIIREGLNRSPIYSGVIDSSGPRYCPSVEDKVTRFADKDSHRIFLEPEGLTTPEIYPNGISTSLPFDIQWRMVRAIQGLEQARITRPGYAIEYDFFDPRDLRYSLESRFVKGLFLAGQVNGTTGYEEAAAQGLLAGINAALWVKGETSWTPRRDQAYLGVLVDDLIVRGAPEPYRMFTSRAEYRLLLREDNADSRLTPKGRELGLIDDARWRAFQQKQEAVERERQRLHDCWLMPGTQGVVDLCREIRALDLLKRPEITYAALMGLSGVGPGVPDESVAEQVEVQCKYDGYIQRQQQDIQRNLRNESLQLPENLDYACIRGLSSEVKEILQRHQPETLGQAGRLSGVTPAAISLLLVHLKRLRHVA